VLAPGCSQSGNSFCHEQYNRDREEIPPPQAAPLQQLAETLAGGVIRNAVNMPSVDAAMLEALRPYLELGSRLGSLVQQIGPQRIEKVCLTFFGRVVDLDAN